MLTFREFLLERKPKGAPDWHDSDAPDADSATLIQRSWPNGWLKVERVILEPSPALLTSKSYSTVRATRHMLIKWSGHDVKYISS
jgi:hypothetical protein